MSRNVVNFLIIGVSMMTVIVSTNHQFCGTNEQWGNCGKKCEGDCDNQDLSECAATSCADSGCQCIPGYLRNNETGWCVLPSECPSKSKTTPIHCGDNEKLGNCGPICEEKCDNSDQMSVCAATSCRGSGCQCKSGYRRNSENNLCVLASECPTRKCKKNEVLGACGPRCEGNCGEPRRPKICSIIRCATQGCQCDLSRGYVRNAQGECVRNQDDECCAAQLVCPPNSEPRICGGVCESSCANPKEIFCKLNPTNCTIDCHCKRGFVRNELTRECVRRYQCYPEPSENTDSKGSDWNDTDTKNSDWNDSDSKDSDSTDSALKDSNSEDSDSNNSDSKDFDWKNPAADD